MEQYSFFSGSGSYRLQAYKYLRITKGYGLFYLVACDTIIKAFQMYRVQARSRI